MSSTKPKYVKLVEIALIKGLGFLDDEQLFSNLNFINQDPQLIAKSLGFICPHV
jgi:hypothetical protein